MPQARCPAYLELPPGELAARTLRGLEHLERCRVCPRDCDVNRMADEVAVCKTGRHAVVSSWFPHFGEEDCLRGWRGSGTIFFAHCNLRCVFCQNYDISQGIKARAERGSTPFEIAAMMLELQAEGCHNINFVTPEHVAPQVVEAVSLAVERGLELPIVYNTSAYDSPASLRLLDGIVDVYMPDFKYWSAAASRRYMLTEDYPEVARTALREMYRQVGPLTFDENGLARRGVLVRHLVMPGGLDETRAILEWLAAELGPDTYLNLMEQYRPAGRVRSGSYPEIDRRPAPDELVRARDIAREVGLTRLDAQAPHPRLVRRLGI